MLSARVLSVMYYVFHISDEESPTQLLDMDISPLSIHSISSATSSSLSGGISDSGKNTLYLNSVMIPYLANCGYEQYYLHVILEILIYT